MLSMSHINELVLLLTAQMSKAQWEQQLGVFRASSHETATERNATTAALVHFAKTFG